jgi:hypothetical protein
MEPSNKETLESRVRRDLELIIGRDLKRSEIDRLSELCKEKNKENLDSSIDIESHITAIMREEFDLKFYDPSR